MAFIRAADVWQLHTKGNQNWPFPAKACQHIYSNADSNGPIFISYVIALTLAYFYIFYNAWTMIKVTRSQWQQGTLLAYNYHWFSFALATRTTKHILIATPATIVIKLTTNFRHHRLQDRLKNGTVPWSSGYLPGANHWSAGSRFWPDFRSPGIECGGESSSLLQKLQHFKIKSQNKRRIKKLRCKA